ncbi:MAG: prepilin-type N-terminal cleavage/methylation domain-containing protein, partial [Gemmatimonadaceae bacterium]
MIGLRSSVFGPRLPRHGFTLLEMAIVLAVMAVSAMLVAPALSRMGQGKPPAVG